MMTKPTLVGQIGLIPGADSVVDWVIQKVTKSPVHHVVVCVSASECIGAEPGGARIRPLTDFPDAIWSNFAFTPRQRSGVSRWAYAHEGTPYSIVDDLVIGIALLTGVNTPRWVRARLDRSDRMICSQLADAALTLGGGVQVFTDDREPGAVYPGSFVPYFKEHGWWPSDV